MEKLSASNEDYLEAIVELANLSGGSVRSVDIASKVGVSKASVNKAINNLQDHGFVTKPFYGDIELTKKGKQYGEQVLSRHNAIFKFLSEELGVEKNIAASEACLMEHSISQDTLARLIEYLNTK